MSVAVGRRHPSSGHAGGNNQVVAGDTSETLAVRATDIAVVRDRPAGAGTTVAQLTTRLRANKVADFHCAGGIRCTRTASGPAGGRCPLRRILASPSIPGAGNPADGRAN